MRGIRADARSALLPGDAYLGQELEFDLRQRLGSGLTYDGGPVHHVDLAQLCL